MYDVPLARAAPASSFTVASPEDVRQKLKTLSEHCQSFKGASIPRALFQLITTSALFFATLATMLWAFNRDMPHVWLPLMFPAAGLLVRLFIIQHDCGHGSFLPTKRMNDMVGRLISILTFTPYDYWRRAHNMHHAASGNLDRRTLGAIDTLTVKEYNALPLRQKLTYRVFRNPFVLLVIGTPLHILVLQRFSPAQTVSYLGEHFRSMPKRQSLPSIMMLNLMLAIVYGIAVTLLGWKPVVFVYIPIVALTAFIGGWLFFMQHQFEEGYWEYDDKWTFAEAAVLGSSYYALPKVLQWFTGNIGLHHIHHLCSAVPNYRLQKCLDGSPELQQMNRITLVESFRCLLWALWDEDRKKMIGFRDLKTA
jgi:omega-6 fatty acid desaturase (delta-12 desaturase)